LTSTARSGRNARSGRRGGWRCPAARRVSLSLLCAPRFVHASTPSAHAWLLCARGRSKELYDTEAIERDAAACVWKDATAGGRLENFIEKASKSAPSAVESVAAALFEHHAMLRMTFDYYAATMGSGTDIFCMSLNCYLEWINHCHIATPTGNTQHAHLQQLFIAVNAPVNGRRKSVHDTKHTLTRAEFTEGIIRIAVARYLQVWASTDFGDGKEALSTASLTSPLTITRSLEATFVPPLLSGGCVLPATLAADWRSDGHRGRGAQAGGHDGDSPAQCGQAEHEQFPP
jgi:hypothetical protein